MAAKPARSRGARIGFLSLCALLLAWTGCEPETCTSSAECGAEEICAGTELGRYRCLEECSPRDSCPTGYRCAGVIAADCPACHVETNACLAAWPKIAGP